MNPITWLRGRFGSIERDPKTGRPVVTSAGKFMGWNTIYGRDGEHGDPYMTRIWLGRLRLHIFHRGDLDEDCHDHPWGFWTFPLTSYVEEVTNYTLAEKARERTVEIAVPKAKMTVKLVVPAFRLTYRPAIHCHRVLGAWDREGHRLKMRTGFYANSYADLAEPPVDYSRKIITLVWRGPTERSWGFLKNRDGQWCWVAWRDYVFNGGKEGPCQ